MEGREKGGHGTRRETGGHRAWKERAWRARVRVDGRDKGRTQGLEGVGLEGTCAGGKAGKRGDTGLRAVALKGTIEGA